MKKSFLFMMLILVSINASAVNVDRAKVAKDYQGLKTKAQKGENVRIIVKVSGTERMALRSKSKTTRTKALSKNTQKLARLKNRMNHHRVKYHRELKRLGALVMEVDATELDALIDTGMVDSVIEDVAVPPTLHQSVAHIGADVVQNAGHTGAGQAVVILDTGVEAHHPSFGGRVVEEACFSSNTTVATSLCPAGNEVVIGAGAGGDCSPTGIAACDHGTHVAGIAAGDTGVAPEADIIAVQIFSQFTPSTCNSTLPCVLTYSSDQIAALEWVLNDANTENIAAINMSIGGGLSTTHCDNDIRADVISDLRDAGIATVIASGNDSSNNSVSFPGCISDAITVGSTLKTSDALSSFSNSADIVDLLAPGSSIQSASIGGSLRFKSGTSMATPHVAGAVTVLAGINHTADVTRIENELESTGVDILDPANNVVTPRINVDAAVTSIIGDGFTACPVDSFWTTSLSACALNNDSVPAQSVSQGNGCLAGGEQVMSGAFYSKLSRLTHSSHYSECLWIARTWADDCQPGWVNKNWDYNNYTTCSKTIVGSGACPDGYLNQSYQTCLNTTAPVVCPPGTQLEPLNGFCLTRESCPALSDITAGYNFENEKVIASSDQCVYEAWWYQSYCPSGWTLTDAWISEDEDSEYTCERVITPNQL